jgi:hypothetical protein
MDRHRIEASAQGIGGAAMETAILIACIVAGLLLIGVGTVMALPLTVTLGILGLLIGGAPGFMGGLVLGGIIGLIVLAMPGKRC